MRQLSLDLIARPEPTLANFVVSGNAELVASLNAAVAGRAERFVYLWGVLGSGRTHLLRGVVKAARDRGCDARFLAPPTDPTALADVPADAVMAIDDAERLDEAAQIGLFAAYNRIRDGGGALIAAGRAAPTAIGVREDLATRLAWGLVYEVHALTDADKTFAMSAHAKARGFVLSDDVVDYLLRHAPRDLTTLMAIIDALDRHSLEARRQITLPLVRDVLREAPILEDER
jgi:DnaA family protein